MNKSAMLILAIILSGSVGAALAQGGPSTSMPSKLGPSNGLPENGMILTEAEAYNHLEQQGYRKIDGLRKDVDGMWHGTAIRGAVAVTVTVDPQGRIGAR